MRTEGNEAPSLLSALFVSVGKPVSFLLVDGLVGWLCNWLVGWLVNWLPVDWLVGVCAAERIMSVELWRSGDRQMVHVVSGGERT